MKGFELFLTMLFNFRKIESLIVKYSIAIDNRTGMLLDIRQELLDIVSSNDIGKMSEDNIRNLCERISNYHLDNSCTIMCKTFKE